VKELVRVRGDFETGMAGSGRDLRARARAAARIGLALQLLCGLFLPAIHQADHRGDHDHAGGGTHWHGDPGEREQAPDPDHGAGSAAHFALVFVGESRFFAPEAPIGHAAAAPVAALAISPSKQHLPLTRSSRGPPPLLDPT
jgi:hypothetical protein